MKRYLYYIFFLITTILATQPAWCEVSHSGGKMKEYKHTDEGDKALMKRICEDRGIKLTFLGKDEGKGGLLLTTHTANLRAQCLYESCGFVCRGLCKNGTELFYLLRF